MRLFFAYWPSPETAARIEPWARRAHALYGGRMMRTETLHMTLAFLGPTEPDRVRALAHDCTGWRLPAGAMTLHEPGCFARARVVWLGPGARDPALEWLFQANERLWRYLAPYGWQRQEPVFRPHVSLLRNAKPGDLSQLRGTPVPWAPQRCILVGSQPQASGSRYTMLAEVPLEPADT